VRVRGEGEYVEVERLFTYKKMFLVGRAAVVAFADGGGFGDVDEGAVEGDDVDGDEFGEEDGCDPGSPPARAAKTWEGSMV
jgi:hypothetical protein